MSRPASYIWDEVKSAVWMLTSTKARDEVELTTTGIAQDVSNALTEVTRDATEEGS